MTIEALLTDLNSNIIALIGALGNQDGATAAAPAAGAAAPARRGRGRPAADDPKTAPVVVATETVATPVVVATVVADPFDDPPPVTPAKKFTKADARAALEAFRARLTKANEAIGDDLATATNKATTRALAWLKEVSGHTTLATLKDEEHAKEFGDIVTKAPTAK